MTSIRKGNVGYSSAVAAIDIAFRVLSLTANVRFWPNPAEQVINFWIMTAGTAALMTWSAAFSDLGPAAGLRKFAIGLSLRRNRFGWPLYIRQLPDR